MFTIRAINLGSFWSLFAWTTTYRPLSPGQEAPRLVDISEHEDIYTQHYKQQSIPPRRTVSTPIPQEYDPTRPSTTFKRKTSIRHVKNFLIRLKPVTSRHNVNSDIEPFTSHRCCTLCRTEIDEDLKYATKAKVIQYDGTYLLTRCCHHFVHSSCYRISLQYFIDSKGRPRCAICRDYPDLFVACWALGYVFDKDVGDADDDECYCPPGVVCEICEGRKQLLEDLQASSLSQDNDDDSLSEKLWTIEEVDEEDEMDDV